jgi:hypothetical protein
MSVLAIESTIIDDDYVTIEAIVDDMRCIYAATYSSPAEYAPALSLLMKMASAVILTHASLSGNPLI